MKPFIVVCGVPHSFTSMVSKFLIDNGAYTREIWGKPKFNLPYHRFEEKAIHDYVENKRKFKEFDLTDYFKDLPTDKVVMAKDPGLTFFLDDLKKYTDRRIKVVYVIRNPEQVILSSMKKTKKDFIFYFERLVWMYRFIVSSPFEVFPFMAERIKKDGKRLLEFCELPTKEIEYNSIQPLKIRPASYVKYRFANFIWKRLSRYFRVF